MDYSKKQRIRNIITATLIVLTTVLLLGLLAFLAFTPNVAVEQTRENCGYIPVEETSRREVFVPNAPVGVVTEYRFTLSEDLSNDPHLAFYALHQYVDVYVDEQKIYSLNPSGQMEDSVIQTIGGNYVMIPLCQEDAGKQALVVLTPVYNSIRNRQTEFAIGSGHAIFLEQLSREFAPLILSVLLIFGGVTFICVAIYFIIVKKRGKSVLLHGILAATIGICRFADARSIAMLMPDRTAFLSFLSIMMLLVGPIPLIKSVKIHLSEKSQDMLDWLCLVYPVNCVLQLILQLTGVAELRQMLMVTHALNLVGAGFFVGIVIYDILKQPEKHHRDIWKWLCMLLVLGVMLDISVFYMNGSSSGLIGSLSMFLIYTVLTGISLGSQFFEKEVQVEWARAQLAQNRLSVMANQIRSHFVFNILNAISGMCKYDPAAADRTVVLFARYLRSNIDTLETDTPVPFRIALRHLEDYVALEKVRFGDRINLITDIQAERFMLPPLIMQPIVENAIKHGLEQKPEGGTICLRTWQEEKVVYIEISDNGVGFDPETLVKQESVGLKNVRFRIMQMLNGTLEIDSAPGKGTTVTISIPCEEVN